MQPLIIDEKLVCRLIASQFPHYSKLPVSPVAVGGWDNRTFHLGKTHLCGFMVISARVIFWLKMGNYALLSILGSCPLAIRRVILLLPGRYLQETAEKSSVKCLL